MARGNRIIVSSDPKGVYLEGIVSGTPKPGTIMEIKYSVTTLTGGEWTWQAFQTDADGKPGLIAVLLEDRLQGKTTTDAYVAGTRCFLYCPVAGEDMNCLVQNLSGTADDHAFGERLMVDNSSGMLIANSSGTSVPFILLETITDPVADTLAWCKYTGH